MAFEFQPQVMIDSFPLLIGGLEYTILITVAGLALGLFLGIVAGLINCGTNKFLKYVATAYIETIRGTPLIVQVMFLYFGLPLALGVRIPPVTAGEIGRAHV